MNKRLLGLVASLVLAGVGTFFLVSYVNQADERAAADETRVEVLVVDEFVARGSPADDITGAVRTVLMPEKLQAAGSVATLADLEGRVASVDLLPGEQLLETRFVTPEILETETKVEVPGGHLQVTLSLEPERALGGRLIPGSKVAVVASFSQNAGLVDAVLVPAPILPGFGDDETEAAGTTDGDAPTATHVILHKQLVTNMQIERLLKDADDAEKAGVELAPTGNLLVTLAVTPADLEDLIFATEHGTVWLAQEPADAPEIGTRIVTRETIFR